MSDNVYKAKTEVLGFISRAKKPVTNYEVAQGCPTVQNTVEATSILNDLEFKERKILYNRNKYGYEWRDNA